MKNGGPDPDNREKGISYTLESENWRVVGTWTVVIDEAGRNKVVLLVNPSWVSVKDCYRNYIVATVSQNIQDFLNVQVEVTVVSVTVAFYGQKVEEV